MSREGRGSTSSKDKDKGSSKEMGDVRLCVGCKKEFKDTNIQIFECERCEEHRCARCIKLSDVEYDLLDSRKGLHWYCGKCEIKVLKSIHLDKEIEQKLENLWAKVEDRLAQFNRDVDSVTESTNAKIQAVKVILTELRTDMNKNLQQMNDDMNKVKTEVDKQLILKHTEINSLSTKVNEIIEGEEWKWI